MAQPKAPPIVACVVRAVMAARRVGVTVPSEVVDLLVVLAERHSRREGLARPGGDVLRADTGFSRTALRRWTRIAEALGFITVRTGKGRGHASEVLFTSAVRHAPGLDHIRRLDLTNRARKGAADGPFSALRKGVAHDEKRGRSRREKGAAGGPPTPVATPAEPLRAVARPRAVEVATVERPTVNDASKIVTALPTDGGARSERIALLRAQAQRLRLEAGRDALAALDGRLDECGRRAGVAR